MAGIDIEKLGLASVAEGTSQAEKNHSIKAGSKFKSLHAHPDRAHYLAADAELSLFFAASASASCFS